MLHLPTRSYFLWPKNPPSYEVLVTIFYDKYMTITDMNERQLDNKLCR
jgi:hypothetical protein